MSEYTLLGTQLNKTQMAEVRAMLDSRGWATLLSTSYMDRNALALQCMGAPEDQIGNAVRLGQSKVIDRLSKLVAEWDKEMDKA